MCTLPTNTMPLPGTAVPSQDALPTCVLRKSSKVPSQGLLPSLAAMVSFLQLNEQLEQP